MMKNVIKNMIRQAWAWLGESNRGKHLVGGMAIGFFADGAYCAAYAGVGVASALEMKDKMYGGEWDWVDWGCTVGGAAIGCVLHLLLF